jgi:hypothetical protein
LATWLALRRRFLTSVKGAEESMLAWVGQVKSMSFHLENVGVDVSDEDTILALTMGLNKSYDSFIISLDTMCNGYGYPYRYTATSATFPI